MDDILIKARELGNLIGESEVLNRLKKAEHSLENDERGMGLMEDYRLLQIELVRATKQNKSEVELADIRNMLLSKQAEISDYPITREFIESKSEFDSLMKNINDVITFAITGEESTGSKCSSCSGGGCSSCH